LVQVLRQGLTPSTATVYAPSFDHAIKDPVEDDIPIPATSRVLFFEGLYLSLDKTPWNDAAKLMDELWFVEVDFETARRRLIKRHVAAGIAKDEEEADRRATENDAGGHFQHPAKNKVGMGERPPHPHFLIV